MAYSTFCHIQHTLTLSADDTSILIIGKDTQDLISIQIESIKVSCSGLIKTD